MRTYHGISILVFALLVLGLPSIDAKRRKHKVEDLHKTKTRTKWSSSSEMGKRSQMSTEEHGYYVKRTYTPLAGTDGKRQNPPYLAIPIAWFGCEPGKTGCQHFGNSGALNSIAHVLSEGYLCDDDCVDPYQPICGETPSEVAVFYNECKLNVAKCRTHGLWTKLPYAQCKQKYPMETSKADKKFKSSPFFEDSAGKTEKENDSNESSEENINNDKPANNKKEQHLPHFKGNQMENVEQFTVPAPIIKAFIHNKPQPAEKEAQTQQQTGEGAVESKNRGDIIADAPLVNLLGQYKNVAERTKSTLLVS